MRIVSLLDRKYLQHISLTYHIRLEQLQFRMQYGDVQPAYSVPKAKIIVEVKPRKILEARQYETSQLGPSYATAEIEERGLEEARQEAVTAVVRFPLRF